jgi:WXXGXW repeat (2 copies)
MIVRWVPVVTALAASAALGGCVEEERVGYVESAPASPPQAAEVVGGSPGPGNVFVRGHWGWDGSRYVWVQGRYLHRHWAGSQQAKEPKETAEPAEPRVTPPADVPPAPTYLPPPPPANPPPPPPGT